MKKQLIALTLAAGLSAVSLPAFAEQDQPVEKKQPVKMTEQEMDNVTAGLVALQLSVQSASVASAFSFTAGGAAAASAFTASRQSIGLALIAF
jgi:hypothetical protein